MEIFSDIAQEKNNFTRKQNLLPIKIENFSNLFSFFLSILGLFIFPAPIQFYVRVMVFPTHTCNVIHNS